MEDDTTTEPGRTEAIADGGAATGGSGLLDRLWTTDSKRYDIAFTVVLWLFVGTLIVYSFSIKPTARHVPLVVAVPTFLILSFILLMLLSDRVHEFVDSITAETGTFGTADAELPGTGEESADDEGAVSIVDQRKRIASAFGTVLGLFVLVYLIGFYVGIPIFLLVVYRWKAQQSWPVTVVATAAIWVFVIVVFHVLLSVRLYAGLLDLDMTPYIPF